MKLFFLYEVVAGVSLSFVSPSPYQLEYLVRVSMKGEITQEAKFRSGIVHV